MAVRCERGKGSKMGWRKGMGWEVREKRIRKRDREKGRQGRKR